jgi:hypothetical protein
MYSLRLFNWPVGLGRVPLRWPFVMPQRAGNSTGTRQGVTLNPVGTGFQIHSNIWESRLRCEFLVLSVKERNRMLLN